MRNEGVTGDINVTAARSVRHWALCERGNGRGNHPDGPVYQSPGATKSSGALETIPQRWRLRTDTANNRRIETNDVVGSGTAADAELVLGCLPKFSCQTP